MMDVISNVLKNGIMMGNIAFLVAALGGRSTLLDVPYARGMKGPLILLGVVCHLFAVTCIIVCCCKMHVSFAGSKVEFLA